MSEKYTLQDIAIRIAFGGLHIRTGIWNFRFAIRLPFPIAPWEDNISVKPHRHAYYEFALVTKGSCVHSYKGVKVPLVPGDVF